MPRITVKENRAEARGLQAFVSLGPSGERKELKYATGFDTDEKWIEINIPTPGAAERLYRPLVIDGVVQKARLHVNYDIVSKSTGEIVYSVRQ